MIHGTITLRWGFIVSPIVVSPNVLVSESPGPPRAGAFRAYDTIYLIGDVMKVTDEGLKKIYGIDVKYATSEVCYSELLGGLQREYDRDRKTLTESDIESKIGWMLKVRGGFCRITVNLDILGGGVKNIWTGDEYKEFEWDRRREGSKIASIAPVSCIHPGNSEDDHNATIVLYAIDCMVVSVGITEKIRNDQKKKLRKL